VSKVVVLFGNGLSIGVAPGFAVPAMTARLNEALNDDLRGALADLRLVSTPDASMPPETVLGFEQLVGPLDRVAHAVQSLAPIARLVDREDCLNQSHAFLLSRYVSLVGLVMADLASSAQLDDRTAWTELNELAVQLRAMHDRHSVALFTLSYDTLLDSALLESRGGWFYDGFAGPQLKLNQPIDRWSGTMPLYHLHGSVLWYEDPNGQVRKTRSDNFMHGALLPEWTAGNDGLGLPVVVLTDAKMPAVARHPFDLFYQELWRELADARVFVVAGYAFGDEPVNRVIRQWTSVPTTPARILEVWSQSADRARARFVERVADLDTVGRSAAIAFRPIVLPDAKAVADLATRL
jgi:hypothetical protein